MNARIQRWRLLGAAGALLLLALSWLMLIQPRQAAAADLDAQVLQVQSQTDQLAIKTDQLRAQFAQMSTQQAELDAIKVQLPPAARMPALLRELEGVAARTGVTLGSLTPGTPSAIGAASAASAAQPVLVKVPLSMVITGDYFETVLFLKAVQSQLSRSVLITGVQLAQADAASPGTPATPAATPDGAPPAGASPTAGAVTPTAAPAAASTQAAAASTTLTLNAVVFVLLDGTSTLDDVKQAAAKLS